MDKGKFVVSAGYLKLCVCGRHARLVTAKGECSYEFACKEEGYEVLLTGYQLRHFSMEEFSHICRQITDSNLPDYNYQIAAGTKFFVLFINKVKNKPETMPGEISSDIIHKHDFWIYDLPPVNTWLM